MARQGSSLMSGSRFSYRCRIWATSHSRSSSWSSWCFPPSLRINTKSPWQRIRFPTITLLKGCNGWVNIQGGFEQSHGLTSLLNSPIESSIRLPNRMLVLTVRRPCNGHEASRLDRHGGLYLGFVVIAMQIHDFLIESAELYFEHRTFTNTLTHSAELSKMRGKCSPELDDVGVHREHSYTLLPIIYKR